MVRVPMHPGVLELERGFWEDFDTDMKRISGQANVPYFNYTEYETYYETYDGSHLHSPSARAFTVDVANKIREYIQRRELAHYLLED